MNNDKIEALALADIKTIAEKRGIDLSDEAAKNILDSFMAIVEKSIIEGDHATDKPPVGLLPSNAGGKRSDD